VKYLILPLLILISSCKIDPTVGVVEVETGNYQVLMEPVCRMSFYSEVPWQEVMDDREGNIYIVQSAPRGRGMPRAMLAYFSCRSGYDFKKLGAYGVSLTCEGLGHPIKVVSHPGFPLQGCLFRFLEDSEFVFTHITAWEQTINQMVAAGWLAE